jgi:hypothetical protein
MSTSRAQRPVLLEFSPAMRSPTLAALVGAFALVVGSCGGAVETDDNSPAGVCARGGGQWEEDGCFGAGDVCGAFGCETAIGPGCHCNAPGQCWDPKIDECRPE